MAAPGPGRTDRALLRQQRPGSYQVTVVPARRVIGNGWEVGMTGLANGAVELPVAHLSARVAWHDTDWTGRVCAAPGANPSCAVLKNIKEKKNVDAEEEDAGQPWDKLPRGRVPPCVFERAGFMRSKSYSIVREH